MTIPNRDLAETRILLVEDDRETRALVASALAEAGHEVEVAANAGAARVALRRTGFGAVVLDVGLPDGSGIELCREWRRAGVSVPILILTARTDVASRVAGLDAGADDYLGKPFALAELRARVRALIRRGASLPQERIVKHGDLVMDFARRVVLRGGVEVPITRRELEVLERLARAGGHAVSRDDLLEDLWGESTVEAGASLEVIVGRLRRKVDAPGSERVIRTIRGYGYALSAKVDGDAG